VLSHRAIAASGCPGRYAGAAGRNLFSMATMTDAPEPAVATPPPRGGLRLAAMSVAALVCPVAGLAILGYVGGDLVEDITLPAWAAPIAVLVIAAVTGLALLPTHLTSLACGYLLGLAVGLPTAVLGVIGGALVGYAIASRLDADALRKLIQRRPLGRRLAAAMIDRGPARATTAVTLARLPPQVPFALGNVLAASLRIPLRPMLTGTAVGMTPRVALVVWLGAELAAWQPAVSPPLSLYLSAAAALIGFGGLTVWSAMVLRSRPQQP